MTQRDCDDCYYSKLEGEKEPCKSCEATDDGFTNFREVPLTNADHIRAMSDEELAEVLSLLTKNDVCVNTSAVFCTGCPFDAFCSDCKEGNELEWLQRPVEEDDHA